MAKVLSTAHAEAQSAAIAKPHGWALSPWARAFRRLARPVIISRHVRRLCRPLIVEGHEHLAEVDGPTILIANHTSHFDTLIVLSLLPGWLHHRTAIAAAADRFYKERLKGAWFSLRYNAFPIARGGGRAALGYSERLLEREWSVLIFPEGSRSRTGDLLPFHPGPAILALGQHAAVLPIHIAGATQILPPGQRWARPAPVNVHVGRAFSIAEGTSVSDATAAMEASMRALAASNPGPAVTGP